MNSLPIYYQNRMKRLSFLRDDAFRLSESGMKAAEGAPSAVSDCGIEDYVGMKPPTPFSLFRVVLICNWVVITGFRLPRILPETNVRHPRQRR